MKPRKQLKVTFGKSVIVSVAISAKRVLMCRVVPDRWNASEAAAMYRTSLGPALKRASPGKKRFLVLEDNNPSGYKTKAALEAKGEVGIECLEFPKRSPDLNPLDYGFWDVVNRRMRKQEAAFPKTKRETRDEFIVRLKRTITRVPESVLTPLVQSMKRRCVALKASGGKHFEE